VLDLRNDPGGLLNSAVGVSAAFLPPDTLVTSTDGRTRRQAPILRIARRLPAAAAGMITSSNLPPRGAQGADGGTGQWWLRFGVRNRRRCAAGPQARRCSRHDDLRQGLGADRAALAGEHRDQADDCALLHALGPLDPGQRHRAGHRRRRATKESPKPQSKAPAAPAKAKAANGKDAKDGKDDGDEKDFMPPELASKNDYQLGQALNLLKGLQIMQNKDKQPGQ
jgi:carboxyl-terminal processing protease